MSSQKYKTSLLRLLSEYANNNKPFSVSEIEGAIALYKISLEEDVIDTPVNDMPVNITSNSSDLMFDISDPSLGSYSADNLDLAEDEESKTNVLSSESTSSEDPIKKWKQVFVDDVVKHFYQKILTHRYIKRDDAYNEFMNEFSDRIPDFEKVPNGKSKPIAYIKFHKTIYNNLIKKHKCDHIDGAYILVRTSNMSASN